VSNATGNCYQDKVAIVKGKQVGHYTIEACLELRLSHRYAGSV
jgi:hypothetical protein